MVPTMSKSELLKTERASDYLHLFLFQKEIWIVKTISKNQVRSYSLKVENDDGNLQKYF